MSETYNGWTNRETWALMLHINNDQGIQSWVHEVVREVLDTSDPNEAGEYPTIVESQVSDALREWVADVFSSDYWREEFDSERPDWADMMRSDVGSEWRINWVECAQSLISDVSEED